MTLQQHNRSCRNCHFGNQTPVGNHTMLQCRIKPVVIAPLVSQNPAKNLVADNLCRDRASKCDTYVRAQVPELA